MADGALRSSDLQNLGETQAQTRPTHRSADSKDLDSQARKKLAHQSSDLKDLGNAQTPKPLEHVRQRNRKIPNRRHLKQWKLVFSTILLVFWALTGLNNTLGHKSHTLLDASPQYPNPRSEAKVVDDSSSPQPDPGPRLSHLLHVIQLPPPQIEWSCRRCCCWNCCNATAPLTRIWSCEIKTSNCRDRPPQPACSTNIPTSMHNSHPTSPHQHKINIAQKGTIYPYPSTQTHTKRGCMMHHSPPTQTPYTDNSKQHQQESSHTESHKPKQTQEEK